MVMKNVGSLSIALLLTVSSISGTEKGDDIARKNFDLKDPQTSYSSAEMSITDKNGSKKTRVLKMYGKEDGGNNYSFIEFDSPADVKGTRLLNISKTGSESEQRIYLPALKKARLIASSGKGGKFVGSDFFYYDLEKREFDDYTFTFLKEDTFGERACNVIEMKPKSSNSPYAKSEAWVSKENSFVYQMKLYDNKTLAHIKTMSVLKTETIDGCIMPTEVLMTNHKDNSETKLVLSDLKVNQGVDDKVFSIQNLETK
jgi:outer membrane lipoprotein-sorting protein